MPLTGTINGRLKNFKEHGLMNLARVHWNLSTASSCMKRLPDDVKVSWPTLVQ